MSNVKWQVSNDKWLSWQRVQLTFPEVPLKNLGL